MHVNLLTLMLGSASISQTLPSQEQLVEEAKKTVSQSETLQKFLGTGLSDYFLKASMWQLDGITDSAQLNLEIKQQRNEVLRRTSTGDSQEVCFIHDHMFFFERK